MSKLRPQVVQTPQRTSRTDNGAIAQVSTGNVLTDFFGTFGSLRGMPATTIQQEFAKAFAYDKVAALKLLFFFRDAREGAKEKQVFLDVFKGWIDANDSLAYELLPFVPEFGYWKDVVTLIEYAFTRNQDFTHFAMVLYAAQLQNDIRFPTERTLAGKWVFDENYARKSHFRRTVFDKFFTVVQKILKINAPTEAQKLRKYRKMIVGLRKELDVVEVKMSAQRWDEINFEGVPSKAHHLYRKALPRHAPELYAKYMTKVEKGEATIKAKVLTPVDLIKSYVRMGNRHALADTKLDRTVEAQWKALDDFVTEDVLVMADTSSSMFSSSYARTSGVTPIEVSIALGIYVAERNKGAFKNELINFDDEPQFISLTGRTLHENVEIMKKIPWGGSTDITAAFDMILELAQKNNVAQADIPKYLLVISDMQFNSSGNVSPAADARAKFESAGYDMPGLIWWNIDSKAVEKLPERNRDGSYLVSGFSPVVLKNVFAAIDGNTMSAIQTILDSPRYAFVDEVLA